MKHSIYALLSAICCTAAYACTPQFLLYQPPAPPAYDYVAVETPCDETVLLDGDTLRYGMTPERLVEQLHLQSDRKELDKFAQIIHDLNPPQTVYGVFPTTSERVTVEIQTRDSTFVFAIGPNERDKRSHRQTRVQRRQKKYSPAPDICRDGAGYRLTPKRDFFPTRHREQLRRMRFDGTFRPGSLNLSLSLPWTHFSSCHPAAAGGGRRFCGFIGAGAGIEYLYRDKQGIAAEWSGMLFSFIPVLAPLDIVWNSPHEGYSVMTAGISSYHHLRRFTFGYGLNCTRYLWAYHYDIPEEGEMPPAPLGRESFRDHYWAAGVSVAGYVNITPRILFGISYKPTFLRFGNPEPWRYEHTIAIELKFYLLR